MANREDLELMASERLKNVKITNDIDYDCMVNLRTMLARELSSDDIFKIKTVEIYDSSIESIPRLPCIVLSYNGSEDGQRTMGKERATFLRNVSITLDYYHEDVNNKMKDLEIVKASSRINSIIQRNKDLNGYSRMGARILRTLPKDKVFNTNIYKCISMSIVVPVLYRDRAAGPGN